MKNGSESNEHRDMIFGFIERQLQLRLGKLEKLRKKNDKHMEDIREKIDNLSQQLNVEDPYVLPPTKETLSDKIRAYCNDIRQGIVPSEENFEQSRNEEGDIEKQSRKPSLHESVKPVKAHKSKAAANLNVETNREKSDISSYDNLPSGTETRSTSAKSSRILLPDKTSPDVTKIKSTNSNASEKDETSTPNTKKSSKKGSKARESLALIASGSTTRLTSRSTKPKDDATKLGQEKTDEKNVKISKFISKDQTRNPTPIRIAPSRKTSDIVSHEDAGNITDTGLSDTSFRPIRAQKTVPAPENTKPAKKSTKILKEPKLSSKDEAHAKNERSSLAGRTKVKHKTTNEKKTSSPTASEKAATANENNKKPAASRSKTPTRHMTLDDVSPVNPDQNLGRRSVTPGKGKDNLTRGTPGTTTPDRRSTSPKPKTKTTENAAEQPENEEPLSANLRKSQRPKRKTKLPAESETPQFSDAKETRFKSQRLTNELQAKAERASKGGMVNNIGNMGKDPQLSLIQGDERWDKNLLSLDWKEMEQENLLASLDNIEDKLQYKEFKEDLLHLEEERRKQFSIAEVDPAKEVGSPEIRAKGSGLKNKKRNLELNIDDIEKENERWEEEEKRNEEQQPEEKEGNTSASLRGEGDNDCDGAKGLTIEISHKIKDDDDGDGFDEHPFDSINSPIEKKNEAFSYHEEEDDDVNGVNEVNDVNGSHAQSQSKAHTEHNAENEEANNENEDDDVNKANDDDNQANDANPAQEGEICNEEEKEFDPNEEIDPNDAIDNANGGKDGCPEESAKETNYESAKKFWTEQEYALNAAIEIRKKSVPTIQNISVQKEEAEPQEDVNGDQIHEDKLQPENTENNAEQV